MIPISLSQCEICHEEFKDPKQLPCRHSFCKLCLEGQVIRTSSNCHLSCHVCGTKVNLVEPSSARITSLSPVDFVQDDYFISSLIEFNRVKNKVDDTIATDVRCLRHQNKQLKYYCDDCNIPVCKVCKTSDHAACHTDTSLLNFRKSDSMFQSDLNSLTKEISLLDDRLSSLTESVRSKMAELFRKKTEAQIEISAYFSNLRTKMNEYLCKLEQQLRTEYSDLLQGQMDTNKEYFELCKSFTKRCNSVNEVVKNLRHVNYNAKNRNKKVSLLQIFGEMKLTTEDGLYAIHNASDGWQQNPDLKFVVHSSEERKLFNTSIADVNIIYPGAFYTESQDYVSETGGHVEIIESDNTQLECNREIGDSVSILAVDLENDEDDENICFNDNDLEAILDSRDLSESGACIAAEMAEEIGTTNDFTENSVEPTSDIDTSEGDIIPGDSPNNNPGMSVVLPTAPPLSDVLYDDTPPPPYTPGIMGECYTPIRPPVFSTHEPPPPYPGLPTVPSRPLSTRRGNIPGAVSNTESPRPRQRSSRRSRRQVTVQLAHSFSVMKPEDRAPGSFLHILWVRSNQFLVVDRWNSKIRLFHENGQVLSGATFKGAQPWDITPLNERQYAVTFPKSRKICMICLSEKPDIVVTDWKSSRYSYICIAYFHRDNVFICGTAAPFSEPRIDIVKYNNTQSCSVIRSFKVDAYGSPIFQYPRSVKVTEDGTIIISDYTMNCVTFVSFDGFVIASYKGRETSHPFEPLGICLDTVNKDVYIVESTRRAVREAAPACIHRLTMDGEFLGIIPKEVGLENPKELSVVHLSDGTVKLVVTKGNGIVQLFQIQL